MSVYKSAFLRALCFATVGVLTLTLRFLFNTTNSVQTAPTSTILDVSDPDRICPSKLRAFMDGSNSNFEEYCCHTWETHDFIVLPPCIGLTSEVVESSDTYYQNKVEPFIDYSILGSDSEPFSIVDGSFGIAADFASAFIKKKSMKKVRSSFIYLKVPALFSNLKVIPNYPLLGFNPAIAKAPEEIKDFYSGARYIALMRVTVEGFPSQCSWPPLETEGDSLADEVLKTKQRSVKGRKPEQDDNVKAVKNSIKDFKKTLRSNMKLQCIVTVLDANFDVLGQLPLDLSNLPPDYAVVDGRLFETSKGDLLVSFNPTYTLMNRATIISRLYFRVVPSSADRPAFVKAVLSTPLLGLVGVIKDQSTHKNMGLVEHGDIIYGIDWAAPVAVMPLFTNLESLSPFNSPAIENATLQAKKSYLRNGQHKFEQWYRNFDGEVLFTESGHSAYEGVVSPRLRNYDKRRGDHRHPYFKDLAQDFDFKFGSSSVHGNCAPVRLPDGKLLNIAHMYRNYGLRKASYIHEAIEMRKDSDTHGAPGSGSIFGGMYTHHFILMSGDHPFEIEQVSSEFCFGTDSDKGCETISFVSGMLLEGEDVILSLGLMDCLSAVHKIKIHEIYEMMRPV